MAELVIGFHATRDSAWDSSKKPMAINKMLPTVAKLRGHAIALHLEYMTSTLRSTPLFTCHDGHEGGLWWWWRTWLAEHFIIPVRATRCAMAH